MGRKLKGPGVAVDRKIEAMQEYDDASTFVGVLTTVLYVLQPLQYG